MSLMPSFLLISCILVDWEYVRLKGDTICLFFRFFKKCAVVCEAPASALVIPRFSSTISQMNGCSPMTVSLNSVKLLSELNFGPLASAGREDESIC